MKANNEVGSADLSLCLHGGEEKSRSEWRTYKKKSRTGKYKFKRESMNTEKEQKIKKEWETKLLEKEEQNGDPKKERYKKQTQETPRERKKAGRRKNKKLKKNERKEGERERERNKGKIEGIKEVKQSKSLKKKNKE